MVKAHTWTSNLAVLPEERGGENWLLQVSLFERSFFWITTKTTARQRKNHFKYWRIRVCDITPEYNILHCISRLSQTLTH